MTPSACTSRRSGKVPLPTNEKEHELAEKMTQGDPTAEEAVLGMLTLSPALRREVAAKTLPPAR